MEDFAKSASLPVTRHLTWPARLLGNNWGLCGLLIIPNLVQRQKGEREGMESEAMTGDVYTAPRN
jgi:hypothetical protein